MVDYFRGKALMDLNGGLKKNATAYLTSEGRLFYHNHETKTSSWLPPADCWNPGEQRLPYGWEVAVDQDGKSYYINHLNKTTTHESPQKDDDEPPPQPRIVELLRDPDLGFGFVAGSERPVIVRFVREGGPSEHKLQAGDQILNINGEDVRSARREHVIELVKSCKHSVVLTVCQPHTNNSTRKSALLTASKKAKLKAKPSRVRFADGVVINGSPLYCPSPFESCVPFIPNVLKVFLENGQTKTFKYDSSTIIEDVVSSLIEKLSIKRPQHFSLCVEHIKSIRRNKLTFLDPKDSLSKIAARPGAHNLRCLLRVAFVPTDAAALLEEDPATFDYLYAQCCNDVVQERFAPELKYEIALRLSALHLHQHAIASGMLNNGKVNLKAIEKECGLEPFVPYSLLDTMKRKELHKLLNHFLKQNQQLCPPGHKHLTTLQAKLHYLKVINELPSYGAKMFPTNIKDSSVESALLISPKYGISHFTKLRHSLPISLAKIEEITAVNVTKDDELCYTVEMQLKNPTASQLHFGLEDKDTEELILVLQGYRRLFCGQDKDYKPIEVSWDVGDSWWADSAPGYHGQHSVIEAPWSYLPSKSESKIHEIDFGVPPPRYIPLDESPVSTTSAKNSSFLGVDHNMNDTSVDRKNQEGIDLSSVVCLEILDSPSRQEGSVEALKRVEEMQQIVTEAENYLADNEALSAKQNSEEEDSTSEHPRLKAADSLLLLTQLDGLGARNVNEQDKETISDDISPCESDTDSLGTASESPSHPSETVSDSLGNNPVNDCCQALSVQIPNPSPMKTTRSCSSFGLHSPDILPSLSDTENELIETLKRLQSNGELPYGDSTLCIDPDIIDLTVIPPPSSPELEAMLTTISGHDEQSDFQVPPFPCEEYYLLSSLQNLNSAQTTTELDDLCEGFGGVRTSDVSFTDVQALNTFPSDIDDFIAAVAVPPPPPPVPQEAAVELPNPRENYLCSLIIPPPPLTSPNFTHMQDEIIAKFWKATDDVKKMCNSLDTKVDSSPSSSARELHSSSSGDSGYDSVVHSLSLFSSDWPQCLADRSSHKFLLPTVSENVSENLSSPRTAFDNVLKNFRCSSQKKSSRKGSLESSSSCSDLSAKKDASSNDFESAATRCYSKLSRSHSWSGTQNGTRSPSPTGKPPVAPKPLLSGSVSAKCDKKRPGLKTNGVNNSGSGRFPPLLRPKPSRHHLVNGAAHDRANNSVVNGYSTIGFLTDSEKESIFIHAQRDIDILLTHLEDIYESRSNNLLLNHYVDHEKYNAAREALVMESRQFVTASKLFVKCATEFSPEVTAHLLECVSLLERMYNIGEIVLLNTESQSQLSCLAERLKEVAATYAYTVDTVHKLTYANESLSDTSTSPYMGLLMDHATSLATALSSLMRTLRAFDS